MKKMARSIKKYIRRQKAEIRRRFFDAKKQEEAITELYNKINKNNNENK